MRSIPSHKKLFLAAVKGLLLVLVMLGSAAVVHAAADAPSSSAEYRPLAPYVGYFRDPTGALTFEAIPHQSFVPPERFLNFGYTDDAIWLRVELERGDFSAQPWLIQFGIPYLDKIDSYQVVDGQTISYHKGRGLSLVTQPFPHRDSLIPVHFSAGKATIYLRIFSRDGTTINASLITEREFERRDETLRFFLGGYVGIMLAMAIYNFFIFLSLRDRRYAYYVFFTLAVLTNVAAHYELIHEYLFTGSEWLNARLNLCFFVVAIAASIEFVRHFLLTSIKMPRLDRLLAGFHALNFSILGYAFLVDRPTSLWLFLMLLPLLLLIAICGIRSIRFGGDALSRYFMLAFSLFIVGVGMFSLRRFGFLAPNPFVNYTFMAGSVVETMILSFALAHQINWLREQKQQAQQQLIQQISDHNTSLEQMKLELEETVKVRTAKLRTSLSEKEMLLREVHHRVKNNLAVVGSLLGFQILREERDSAVSQALRAGQSRVQSMALVHELLCASGELSQIDIKEYFERLSKHLQTSFSHPDREIAIDCQIDPVTLPMDVLVACGLIATELITNSLKHAFNERESGRIVVRFKEQYGHVELTVADDGCGLEQPYPENLGMRLVTMMTSQLNGTLKLENAQGSCWTVCFEILGV